MCLMKESKEKILMVIKFAKQNRMKKYMKNHQRKIDFAY